MMHVDVRLWRRFIVPLAVVLLVGATGFEDLAAQTMEFGKDEADDTMTFEKEKSDESKSKKGNPEDRKQAKQFIEEAKSLYEEGKYDQASLILHRVVSQKDLSAPSTVPEARYELGRTLIQMKLYQGALVHLEKIAKAGSTHAYYIPALTALLNLSDVIPSDPNLRKALARYADQFPDQIPEDYRDRYAYLVGRHFHGKMNVERAVDLLDAVNRQSSFYAKAQYIKGTTHVADYSAEPAVQSFKGLLTYLLDRKNNQGLDAEQQKLLELTRLAMGRVFYSTGDYETSLKYYDKIDRDSPRWPRTLFESSWAHFQIDQYNRALGNLHSLTSPFFEEAYFPEGPILASVIYFYNCKYDRVRYELERFEATYAPLQKKLQNVLGQQKSNTQMHKWYEKVRNGDVTFSEEIGPIVRGALDDKKVRQKFDLVELIDREVDKIRSMPSSWTSSPLGQSLLQEANLARSFAVEDAGSLTKTRLERVVDNLDELLNQKKKILFEVARAEKGQIEADIRAGMEVDKNVKKREIEAGSEAVYWEFKGEYWRDEVGHYVFNVGSKCQR